jgi:hypothetical protein
MREAARKSRAFARELVDVRGDRCAIAITANLRAHVFADHPNNVRSRLRAECGRRARREKATEEQRREKRTKDTVRKTPRAKPGERSHSASVCEEAFSKQRRNAARGRNAFDRATFSDFRTFRNPRASSMAMRG